MTLRKMYLVPAAAYDARRLRSQALPKPPPVTTKRATKRSGRTASQHPHEKWLAVRKKLLEADITEADLMHSFAEILRKVLPHLPSREAEKSPPTVDQRPKIETVVLAESPRRTLVAQQPEPPSASTSYEESSRRAISGSAAAETYVSDDTEQGA